MNLSDIKTISRQFSQLSHIRYGKRIRAHRDWLALLAVTAILLLAVCGWSAFLFFEEPKPAALPEAESGLPSVSEESLGKVEALFEARDAERARYQAEYRFVDPAR